MTHLISEQRLTLNQLAHREGVNPSTVWRWSRRGVRGISLETFSVGTRRYTTEEAFERFVQATTAAANGEQLAISRTNRQHLSGVERAEQELAADGI